MSGKGQASIEALLVLLAFFIVLAQFASIELEKGKETAASFRELKAGAYAEKCSAGISAMSANPGAMLAEWKEKCYGKGNSTIYYSDGNTEQGAETIAAAIQTIQKGNGFSVRLENETHYR
ncbi:MAG: hypothetical protein NT067_05845 [Candidatus Diapherotrites archaeon]|nr:hypothetical protein [Candidatus Diapherotrites archaeon]